MIPGRTGRSDGGAIASDRGCSPRLCPCRVPLVLGTSSGYRVAGLPHQVRAVVRWLALWLPSTSC
jgi:hypothetical protein